MGAHHDHHYYKEPDATVEGFIFDDSVQAPAPNCRDVLIPPAHKRLSHRPGFDVQRNRLAVEPQRLAVLKRNSDGLTLRLRYLLLCFLVHPLPRTEPAQDTVKRAFGVLNNSGDDDFVHICGLDPPGAH